MDEKLLDDIDVAILDADASPDTHWSAKVLRRAKTEILGLRTQRDNILALYDSVQASAQAEMRRKKP